MKSQNSFLDLYVCGLYIQSICIEIFFSFSVCPRHSYECMHAKSRREASGTYMAHNGQCGVDIARDDSSNRPDDGPTITMMIRI